MKQRAITAVFFAAAMIGGIYGGIYTFLLLFLLISAGCLWELNELLLPKEESLRTVRKCLGLGFGLLPYALLSAAYLNSSGSWCAVGKMMSPSDLILYSELTLVGALFIAELFFQSQRPFPNVANYVLGLFYVGIPFCLLLLIAIQSRQYYPHRVFGLLWLVWTNDTMAYLIGSRIGRHKLLPRISPNKTWEGTIGGAVCAVGMAWLLLQYFDDYSPVQWLALGAVVGVFGTLGDLVESMLKRSVGVKDSGSLLPGHGGLLDRFDAFLFVLPFAWLMVELLKSA